MTTMTFELPEALRTHVEERLASSGFPDMSSYLQDLIARDLQRSEINRKLAEAEDEYERGEFTVHKPGDFQRMYDAMKTQRNRASKP